MSLRPLSSAAVSLSPRAARLAAFTTLLVLVLCGAAGAARAVVQDGPEPLALEIGEGTYYYFPLRKGEPLSFTVEGPALFEPILRWRFEDAEGGVNVDVELALDGEPLWHRIFRAVPGSAAYASRADWKAGSPARASVDVPSGDHVVTLSLVNPDSGVLDVNPVVKAPPVLPWRLAWRGEVGAAYDSNIFRYSDDEIDDFLDGLRQDRFPSDYIDDLRLEPSLDLKFLREEPGRRETELRLSADYRLATVNTVKSFGKLGARLTERRDGLGYAVLDYYAIPSYHVRDLWDPDVDTGSPYRSCDFRKNAVSLGLGTDRRGIVNLAAELKYDRTGYGPDFVEYDSDAWTWGVTTIVRPVRGLRLDATYALRSSAARGYDEIGETKATSDDSDISYEQDEYSLRARWAAGRVRDIPVVFVLGGRMARRFYQTDRTAQDDPYHAGRDDTYMTFWLRNGWEIAPDLTLEGFYVLRTRSAESEFTDEIGTLKDYTAHRAGIRLIFEGERFLD